MGLFSQIFGSRRQNDRHADNNRREENKEYADSALVAVVTGKTLPVEKISDEMFAQEVMGKTFAIVPSGTQVVSPANGEITMIFPTGHAFGIMTNEGIGLLVHIGVDTVELQGKGFKILAKPGEKVKAGQPVIEIDVDEIKAGGKDPVTMLIVTELPDGKEIHFNASGEVHAGDKIN